MRTMARVLYVFLFMTVILSAAAHARSSAHGSDLERDQDNVWFLGEQPVSYCIQRHPKYPFSETELASIVDEGIAHWLAFFKKYNMDQAQYKNFADGIPRGLSLQFQRQESCAKASLQFLFGVTNALVQFHRPDESHALGVAIRGSYDFTHYRNPGVIWIQNFSSDRRKVLHIVLHELGHIFGMRHDTVWVMDSDVANILRDKRTGRDPAIGMIESPAWKYNLREGDELEFTYRGEPDPATGMRFYSTYFLSIGRKLFRLQGANHSLKIKFVPEFDKKDSELPFKTKFFQLILQTPEDGERIFKGKFEPMVLQEGGPSLYAPWKEAHGGVRYERRGLIRASFADPANGYFEVFGEKIPAVIKYEKGPVLGLFMNGQEGSLWWWSSIYEGMFTDVRRRQR